MANSQTTTDSLIKMVLIVGTRLTTVWYALAKKKCQVIPSTLVRYLGFYVDSKKQAYLFPYDKKDKFIALRETILSYQNAKAYQTIHADYKGSDHVAKKFT